MDECRCMCHTSDYVKHCMPCCFTCDICGRRIKGSLDMHNRIAHPDEHYEVPDKDKKIEEEK